MYNSVTLVLEFEGAEYFYQMCYVVKSGFSEKATKFEKNLRCTFDKERRDLCAQQLTCQKVDEDFSKQMWSTFIIQI